MSNTSLNPEEKDQLTINNGLNDNLNGSLEYHCPDRLLPNKTDVAYEKMEFLNWYVSQIQSKDDVICQKALIILCQMFHKPENIYLGFVEAHIYGRQRLLEKLKSVDAVLSLFLFNRLVKLIEDEKMNLKSIILEIIARCIRYGKPKIMPATAIKLNIIIFFKNLLLSGMNTEQIKRLATSSKSELILKAARIALSVIYWKPWKKYNFEEESKKFIL
ncbi:hypothetical protein LY90DRAFT_706229 [Neocallimastix californiae]|uniref:Uncharacterized protein n=1 Tax=Neocallimastix californiae TaxID=1754190 RepID=A0A1Y2ATP2_9FUNG|nr:hypothetical protein LY90DRAFT_706229 [Neocallimastix californiae]|eukprot:ORY25911.1 hypothetical protein LY90DRAFT_706229 [Neocallimastix californiae]